MNTKNETVHDELNEISDQIRNVNVGVVKMKTGNGIYWVFFETKNNDEMKLQVEALNRESARMKASMNANNMKFGWKFTKVQACR